MPCRAAGKTYRMSDQCLAIQGDGCTTLLGNVPKIGIGDRIPASFYLLDTLHGEITKLAALIRFDDAVLFPRILQYISLIFGD